MRTHRTTLWLSIALFLGLSSGALLVARTIEAYSGACEKLDGFPGLLQAAGFVPLGHCKFTNLGVCPGPKVEACVVNGKLGHCQETSIDGKKLCVCVKDRISK